MLHYSKPSFNSEQNIYLYFNMVQGMGQWGKRYFLSLFTLTQSTEMVSDKMYVGSGLLHSALIY